MFEKIDSSAGRRVLALLTTWLIALGPIVPPAPAATHAGATATPIQHLVVVFQENVSFDHYFGTYPSAANPPGEPPFHARPGTPTVNGLTNALLNNNPNLNPLNGTGATNPFRLDRTQAVTADQNHDYMAEQQAYDMGALDLFPLVCRLGRTASSGKRHHQHEWPGSRILRRQHSNRVVELCSALRHE